jgi:hypothetical protein
MRGFVLRRLLAAVLVMGMFAHAAAVVRHAAIFIGTGTASAKTFAPDSAIAALEADLKFAICHPGNEGSGAGTEGPVRSNGECPICAGLACAFTMPSPQHTEFTLPRDPGLIAFPVVDQRVARHRFLRPASRGPPAFV